MRKLLIIVGLVIVLVSIGFYLFNSYIYNEKQANPNKEIQSYRGTLTGEYVCLPHADQSGPQTLECAFGFKTESNEYYAIDFNLMSQTPPEFITGDKFSASGVITPIELLSTDHWRKYAIEGIFSVTDSVEKLN